MNVHVGKPLITDAVIGILKQFFDMNISFNKEEGIDKDDYILNIAFKFTKHKKQ